jgi:hypothetical protein
MGLILGEMIPTLRPCLINRFYGLGNSIMTSASALTFLIMLPTARIATILSGLAGFGIRQYGGICTAKLP